MTEKLPSNSRLPALELWAGIECSLTRIGDTLYDQLAELGHYDRPEDIDRIADLGVRTVRYPVSWERICPTGDLSQADWLWTDRRMQRWRERDVEVIATLLHHGSGPLGHTSLVDNNFADELARFARAAAERYPWVRHWTPVNEPLTTARFAALYGVWYPHHRSADSFARALMNEIVGTARAMRAIRRVIPEAVLVQTEDLGKTYATLPLTYQADFENARRWITWDLLCGRVRDDSHTMWGYLRWAGIPAEELYELADNPYPPDILGIDHYLTSERFLDHRLDRYPERTWGGNHHDRYADIEAVRVLEDGVRGGHAGVLKEAWHRYRIPIAVTEVHLGTTDPDDQIRWLAEAWKAAQHVRQAWNADIRSITTWSALGAYDWNSLMTRRERVYERGVWDVEDCHPDGTPRESPIAELVRALCQDGDTPPLPAFHAPGWWQCDVRLLYPQVEGHEVSGLDANRPQWKRILSLPTPQWEKPASRELVGNNRR